MNLNRSGQIELPSNVRFGSEAVIRPPADNVIGGAKSEIGTRTFSVKLPVKLAA
jgi:hypothetical protein